MAEATARLELGAAALGDPNLARPVTLTPTLTLTLARPWVTLTPTLTLARPWVTLTLAPARALALARARSRTLTNPNPN